MDVTVDDDVNTSVAECDIGDANIITPSTNPKTHRQLFSALLKLSYPIILCELFQSLLPVVDIAFVGNLSKEDLAAAALATTWFNICNVTMFGFMTGIDTLLAQSFGANQFLNYAIWTGNSLVIVFVATVVISGVMTLCGPFMHLIVADPKLSREAGMFALRLIPGLFPYYSFKVLSKYLQTQHILAPSAWIGAMANVMNAVFNWTLIYKAGWGVAGSPWATSFTRTAELLLIVAFMMLKRSTILERTWPKLSGRNLSTEALAPFMQISLPGALAFFARGGFFEATTLMASFLGIVSLGAHSIALSMNTFLFVSFPFAIGNAASILVGSFIGEAKPIEAKKSFHVSLFFSYITQLMVISVLLCWRIELGKLFSNDYQVSNVVSGLIPIMCVFLINDASVATSGGVFRGLGRQKWILSINLFGSWILAMPVAYCLAFKTSLEVYGLWWGMSVGVIFSAITCQFILNYQVKWQRECRNAAERLSSIHITNRRSSQEPLLPQNRDLRQRICDESDPAYTLT
eukprot:CCRYP_009191-RA/>CCRYP_009191-RA protein AED:0.07 eAED:0.07 QI:1484/1/1/1/0/0/3/663/517